MNTKLIPVLLLILLFSACQKQQAVPAPALTRPPTAVSVVTLMPESVTLTREFPSLATVFLVAEIRLQVTGIVQGVRFTEGGQVIDRHFGYYDRHYELKGGSTSYFSIGLRLSHWARRISPC